MENPTCELCQGLMTKTETVNSGNAHYTTFVCKTCNTEKTLCQGIDK